MMLILAITLVLVCFVLVTKASNSCNDPISCALAGVTIDITNLNISNSLYINTLECTNITIGSLPSAYVPPTNINIAIQDLYLSCAGTYTGPSAGGPFTTVFSQFSINLQLDLVPQNISNIYYPWAFQVPHCDGSLIATVVLVGQSGAKVKGLQNQIASAFETLIPPIVCKELTDTLQVNATKTLQEEVDPLLELLTNVPIGPVPPYDSNEVNWFQLLSVVELVLALAKTNNPAVFDKFQRPLINTLINLLTDNTGMLVLPVNKVMNLGSGGNATINSIAVSGLNSFADIMLLGPSTLSNVAIKSQLGLGVLDVVLNVTVTLPPTPQYSYTEWVLIEGKLVNTTLVLDTLVPVQKSALQDLYVTQLKQPGCWIDTVSVASLSLETVVSQLSISQVRGSAVQLDKDAVALVDNILELVIDGYGPLVTDVINGIVQLTVRPKLNDKIATLVGLLPCTHNCPSDNSYVIWGNNTLIEAVGFLVNDVIGPSGLNTLLRAITQGTGSLTVSSEHLTVTLGGLTSFDTLSILNPVAGAPFDLSSYIGLGTCNSQICTPVSLDVSISGGFLNTSSLPITIPPSVAAHLGGSSLEFSISLSNLAVHLESLIELSKGLLCDLRVSQVNTRGCFLAASELIALKILNVQISAAQSSLNGEPSHDSTLLVQKFLSSLGSASTLDTINSKLLDVPSNANRTCLGLPPAPAPTKAPVFVNISAADFGSVSLKSASDEYNYWEVPVVIFCVLSAVMLVGLCCYREYKLYATPIRGNKSNEEEDSANAAGDRSTICGWIYYMRWKESLIGSSKISFLTKAFVVVSLGVCFGLFIRCLLDKDVLTIKAKITTPRSTSEVDIYDVALPDIINDLWDSGSYLASFLGGFGMVWCYPVIAIAALCFLLPPDILPVKHRGNWLSFCCMSAKANNVNWFFSVYFDPLFYFDVAPSPTLNVLAYWVVERGFTIYACVFFYFLVLLQIVLGCHRVAVEEASPAPVSSAVGASGEIGMIEALDLECMKDHCFSVSSDLIPSKHLPDGVSTSASEDKKLSVQFTAFTKVMVLILIWASFVFLLCGSILESMTYKILGLLSLLITEDPTSQYSVLSIAQYFPQTTDNPSDPAALFTTVLFILYSLVIPLMAVSGFALLWYFPMKPNFQRNMLIFTEACMAFAQFDVAVLTLIVNTETDSFAAFLALVIGDYCDGINVILEEYFDTVLEGNDKCFTISTHLSQNAWTIFVALVCYLSLMLVLLLSFSIASEERRHHAALVNTDASRTPSQAERTKPQPAKLAPDLNEPLLIKGNSELIVVDQDSTPEQKSTFASFWRKMKGRFLGVCFFLSIIEVSPSRDKVISPSMDGRDVAPTKWTLS